jgi:hypothetical protein
MGKLTFWFMIGLVAAIWIYTFKLVASQTNVQGLKDFAQAL